MKKIISLVIPAYNEEGNIGQLYRKLDALFKQLTTYDFEIIFVNDGSTDHTAYEINTIVDADDRVRYVEFSRNFNKEVAISAGLTYAQGNCVIIIDSDLQHPVEIIPDFIKKWELGAEIVIGVRKKNEGAGIIRGIATYIFYKIMQHIGDVRFLQGETDFRLIDACVVREFLRFTEHERMTRGLINWLGFKKEYVYFVAGKRLSGTPSYDALGLIKLGVSALLTHSVFPLQLAGYLGGFITLFSVLFGIFIVGEVFIMGDPMGIDPSGTSLLAIMIMFLSGITLSCLGLMSFYISNIRQEVANRPLYIVSKTRNIEDNN